MHLIKTLFCAVLLISANTFAADINIPSSKDGSFLVAQNTIRDDIRARESSARSGDARNKNANEGSADPKSKTLLGKTGLTQCQGEFALCAASTCTPTGKKIKVNEDGGKTSRLYEEASCTCPIIDKKIAEANGVDLVGLAAVNEGNMKGSCDRPGPGKIWSYFASGITVYPQESATPPFAPRTAVPQTCAAGSVGTNCWNFECTVDKPQPGSPRTATCFCPIGESYIGHKASPKDALETMAGGYYPSPTQACSQLPVSGPIPANL
ncbi:hypothetical protein [Polynucleobacter asymbioticus]|uniref:Uncharacterized protein n=1 Tax=Polynucleobacter asymbioticus (strain DSM 18221 / CIP 109841 / QLW-P1DMWA-1) TaxID=312153 RepID=A4SXN2_POLAQ|nr:hypothetical protein [Polynucleobacter asymbioticus]ABP34246.1 hypothetical protein Pnuc_1030 [Polynucleobacter asymbioticus QLW-P1DMWA-1]